MRAAVVDTTVLSNFAHAQRADLLHEVFGGSVATTSTVMAELHVGEERNAEHAPQHRLGAGKRALAGEEVLKAGLPVKRRGEVDF